LFRSVLEKVDATHPVAFSFFDAAAPLLPPRLPFALPMEVAAVQGRSTEDELRKGNKSSGARRMKMKRDLCCAG
jgi:hypothetical protein